MTRTDTREESREQFSELIACCKSQTRNNKATMAEGPPG